MALALFIIYIIGIFVFYKYVYKHYIVTLEKADVLVFALIWPVVLIVWLLMWAEETAISAYKYIYDFLKRHNIV